MSSAGALALGGCASLTGSGARLDASAISANPTLLVATTRKPVNGGRAEPWFGAERSSAMTVARAKLVAPSEDRFSFAAVGLADWRIDAIERAPGEVGDLLAPSSGVQEVLIYVHGFRQTFEQAALDAGRLSGSIKFGGQKVVVSWLYTAGLLAVVDDG